MFCPDCRSEYREGIRHCNDCDAPLVETLAQAGKQFDDDVLAPLHLTSNFELLAWLADAMEQANIPYVIEAGTGLALLQYEDETGGHFEPEPWEGRILVYGPLLDRAKEILADGLEQLQRRPVPNNALSSQ